MVLFINVSHFIGLRTLPFVHWNSGYLGYLGRTFLLKDLFVSRMLAFPFRSHRFDELADYIQENLVSSRLTFIFFQLLWNGMGEVELVSIVMGSEIIDKGEFDLHLGWEYDLDYVESVVEFQDEVERLMDPQHLEDSFVILEFQAVFLMVDKD